MSCSSSNKISGGSCLSSGNMGNMTGGTCSMCKFGGKRRQTKKRQTKKYKGGDIQTIYNNVSFDQLNLRERVRPNYHWSYPGCNSIPSIAPAYT